MKPSKTTNEATLLGCFLIDNNLIDKAVASGLTKSHFIEPWQCQFFEKAIKIRATGGVVDITSLAVEGVPYADAITVENATGTSMPYASALDQVLWAYSKSKIDMLCLQAKEVIKTDSATDDARKQVASLVTQMQAWIADKKDTARTCEEIGAEVEQWAQDLIDGKPDNRVKVEWPLPTMNERFGPIMPNELCCLAARPKEGKTSVALQIIGHNLKRGLKMAYFTMETSDSATLKMIASQMAQVDLRNIANSPRDKQQNFLKYVKKLRASKNLAIFEKDMNILSIEARCRMLKAGMQPDFIVIDHLHLIQNDFGDKQYEKITDSVNRIIELRKHMGCAIILCLQLNRANVNAERAPRASDAKDSGAIEAAAHRMVIPYRPPNDFMDQPQVGPEALMRSTYDYFFIQDICRDGPSGVVKATYLSQITTFIDCNK
jgi:replicative DNA helicase